MESNIEKLEEWYNSISTFEKLKFSAARQLFVELQNEVDDRKKAYKRNKLIEGTLYVVYKFVNSNGLCSLNSTIYDMDDIISTCNELWINAIDNGKLLEVDSFSKIFNNKFYSDLTEGLISTKYLVCDNINQFLELFLEFIKQKAGDYDLNYNKFLKILLSNEKYSQIIHRMFYYNDNIVDAYKLFEGIFESLNDEDKNFLKLSKTKIDKLKYILISNGLEMIRENIDNVKEADFTDDIMKNMCCQQIIDFIFNNSFLNESEKSILKRRFGLGEFDYHTLSEVAFEDGVTRERIRQKEIKALRKLRKPTIKSKFREFN